MRLMCHEGTLNDKLIWFENGATQIKIVEEHRSGAYGGPIYLSRSQAIQLISWLRDNRWPTADLWDDLDLAREEIYIPTRPRIIQGINSKGL